MRPDFGLSRSFAVVPCDVIQRPLDENLAPALFPNIGACDKCGLPARARCIRCLHRVYCSTACQSADWNIHKQRCAEAFPVHKMKDWPCEFDPTLIPQQCANDMCVRWTYRGSDMLVLVRGAARNATAAWRYDRYGRQDYWRWRELLPSRSGVFPALSDRASWHRLKTTRDYGRMHPFSDWKETPHHWAVVCRSTDRPTDVAPFTFSSRVKCVELLRIAVSSTSIALCHGTSLPECVCRVPLPGLGGDYYIRQGAVSGQTIHAVLRPCQSPGPFDGQYWPATPHQALKYMDDLNARMQSQSDPGMPSPELRPFIESFVSECFSLSFGKSGQFLGPQRMPTEIKSLDHATLSWLSKCRHRQSKVKFHRGNASTMYMSEMSILESLEVYLVPLDGYLLAPLTNIVKSYLTNGCSGEKNQCVCDFSGWFSDTRPNLQMSPDN